MKFLLDTHALLWWLADDAQLGQQARGLIADPGNDVLVSVASLWEIVIKVRVGKLQASVADIMTATVQNGFRLLDIAPAHLLAVAALPKHHRDPFDHLLIAQAMSEAAMFMSDDGHAPAYGVGVVRCRN